MNKLNNLEQNLKGKLQEVKGEVEIKGGKSVQGNIDILKGETNQKIANLRHKI